MVHDVSARVSLARVAATTTVQVQVWSKSRSQTLVFMLPTASN